MASAADPITALDASIAELRRSEAEDERRIPYSYGEFWVDPAYAEQHATGLDPNKPYRHYCWCCWREGQPPTIQGSNKASCGAIKTGRTGHPAKVYHVHNAKIALGQDDSASRYGALNYVSKDGTEIEPPSEEASKHRILKRRPSPVAAGGSSGGAKATTRSVPQEIQERLLRLELFQEITGKLFQKLQDDIIPEAITTAVRMSAPKAFRENKDKVEEMKQLITTQIKTQMKAVIEGDDDQDEEPEHYPSTSPQDDSESDDE